MELNIFIIHGNFNWNEVNDEDNVWTKDLRSDTMLNHHLSQKLKLIRKNKPKPLGPRSGVKRHSSFSNIQKNKKINCVQKVKGKCMINPW